MLKKLSCSIGSETPARPGVSCVPSKRSVHAILASIQSASCRKSGNNLGLRDLIIDPDLQRKRALEPAMNAADKFEAIDRKTSRSICDAVGERLQRDLTPDRSGLSTYLQSLMDELRRRDAEDRR